MLSPVLLQGGGSEVRGYLRKGGGGARIKHMIDGITAELERGQSSAGHGTGGGEPAPA